MKTLKLVMFIATSAFFFGMFFKILIGIEWDILGEEYVTDAINNNGAVGFFVTAYGMQERTRY